MKLENRIAVVTGASRGIGFEIALGFANEGADLVVCARNEQRLQELVRRLRESGRRAHAVQADVSQETDVARVIEDTLEEFGRIDVLCSNAGVNFTRPVDEMPPEEWDEIMAVNLRGPYLLTRAVLPHMKQRDYGRIVHVSSMSALVCAPGSAAYGGSKAALNVLSRTTANETSEFNILVNAMSPGFLKTDMNPKGTRPASAAVPTAIELAALPDDGPSGRFYRFQEEVVVIPEVAEDAWKN